MHCIKTVDGYVCVTVSVKAGSFPGRESFNKTHSSNPRHQIHLSRGDQTAHDGAQRDATCRETDVTFFEQLCYWVVTGHVKRDSIDAYMFSMHVL